MESDLIPHTASPVLAAKAVLILAPHPDDEVFGCAGAVVGHVALGVPVQVVILTDGAAGGDPATRAEESSVAAQILGYGEPDYWNLPDRGLRYSEALVQRIVTKLQTSGVDLVYAPSPWEVHPDHRQATMLAVEAVRRLGYPLRLAFYEIGAPLAPNMLLDISAVATIKSQAMRCFVSQQAQQDYARHIDALNQYRSYTLPRGVQAAEAFCVLSAADVGQAHLRGALPNLSRPLGQQEAAIAEQPLVSILIRSVDRDYLAQALDSVALQTYPNIEVIVVAARPGHGPLPPQCGGATVELVQTAQPLGRSQAANLALSLARGRYLMMLDDDDWLMPDHVAKLALVLQKQPNALAAYTGVSLVDQAGRPIGQVFDLPFDAVRLSAGNLTPIHAVLFKAEVRGLGCRFDESLHHYEDWDFWLQLSKFAPMVHVPGVSAAYRIHDSSGVHAEPGPAGQATQRIYQKWQDLWEPAQLQGIMRRVWSHQELEVQHGTLRGELDELRRTLAQSVLSNEQLSASYERQLQQLDQQSRAMQTLTDTLAERAQTIAQHMAVIAPLKEDLIRQRQTIADMLASRSWRVTQPLRWTTDFIRYRVLGQPVRLTQFAGDTQASAGPVHRLRAVGRLMQLTPQVAAASGGWVPMLRKLTRSYVHGGLAAVVEKAQNQLNPVHASLDEYEQWIAAYDTLSHQDREAIRNDIETWAHPPLISVVMPTYNTDEQWLRRAIDSVMEQLYPHWELCIADDASSVPHVRAVLEEYRQRDARIKVDFRTANGHISAASNSALALAHGDYIALLDHDDELPDHALYHVAKCIRRHPDGLMIYSDEDKIDTAGRRSGAYFKPDWNPDLFHGQNLFSHLGVYQTSLVRQVGGFRLGLEGSQDYDLALRCVEVCGHAAVRHIPKVLYHWRIIAGSTAAGNEEKPYAFVAATRAVTEHLQRMNVKASVEEAAPNMRMLRVRYALPDPLPLVSVIVTGGRGASSLRRCISSLLVSTAYSRLEIILAGDGAVEASSQISCAALLDQGLMQVLDCEGHDGRLTWVNRATEVAKGELLCFLDGNVEVVAPNWLGEMVSHAIRPEVGAVGACLRYPDGSIRHGGMILGLGGVSGPAHHNLPRGHYGYGGRATLTQNYSALTIACMVVRKKVFEEAGGMDAHCRSEYLAGIDLCLKIRSVGYRNLWTPFAELCQHDPPDTGPTGNFDAPTRAALDVAYLKAAHGNVLDGDPAYNVNLDLTRRAFALASPPRAYDEEPA